MYESLGACIRQRLIEQMLSTFLYRLSGHGTLHLL